MSIWRIFCGLECGLNSISLGSLDEQGFMEKKAITFFLIFLSVSFLVTSAWAAPTGAWTTKAALPEVRADMPGVEYNGVLYVFGGYEFTAIGRAEVFAYDPSANSWT